ncbi:4-hydroxybenzoate octaprenyltransferase [Legionella dresdenensis]|uniref:4-hydroxybenzoate octaprenyltransferase n=1 Tax=Legionella dresdenensis TaxID=450200 RepID=A0ABV8CHC1_9GAMM
MKLSVCLRLMRLDKPIGIFLLWLPTAWALWLANKGAPPLRLSVLFFLGTVLMRSAGCVVNDIADRQIDLHVKRTRERPLTSGQISLQAAIGLLAGLLLMALLVLIQLPAVCFYYALGALLVTVIYPFCKRYIQGPQLVLGLAFCMGIPMAYAASGVAIDFGAICLLLINFCWIVAYDTEYAMVDKADDLKIGVKSTAIWFADYDRIIIAFLHAVCHGLWLIIAIRADFYTLFYGFWFIAGTNLIYQHWLLSSNNESYYFRAFLTNSWYGLWMWLAIALTFN